MNEKGLDALSHTWAVVLAGGEGVRLRPLIRRLYGEARPKQFAALLGARSLLRQTLDRVRLLLPPDRTVVVTRSDHDGYVAEALGGAHVRRVLAQPEDRGTAAGILLAVHWIHRQDPNALVTVFPSDHFVSEEEAFMELVGDLARLAGEHPKWIGLLGATPTEPDPDYGWIEPGEVVAWDAAGAPISRVRQFWEKPSSLAAGTLMEKGWLWNTFVFASKASLLVELAGHLLPGLERRLAGAAPFLDTGMEAWALQHAYALARGASFSRALLERCPDSLVVCRLPALAWSDWGTQERVLASLRQARVLPPWFEESDLPAVPPTGHSVGHRSISGDHPA
ncbi:MAG: NTP transferase domain-containing protein [Candidatus Rokubacteria bacterium]|nr:NTP transferase domain-containing protein [Candidatus Rokubacteria bacterium]